MGNRPGPPPVYSRRNKGSRVEMGYYCTEERTVTQRDNGGIHWGSQRKRHRRCLKDIKRRMMMISLLSPSRFCACGPGPGSGS
jgi:hypothetical protein